MATRMMMQQRAALCRSHVACPTRPHHGATSRKLVRHCTSGRTGYLIEAIRSAEEEKDWMSAFEAIIEAKVVNAQLPPSAVQSAIRTLAQGGQHSRAAELMDTLLATSVVPEPATVKLLFIALAQGKQPDRAHSLLQDLSKQENHDPGSLVFARNVVIRTMARADRAVEAYTMLDKMVSSSMLVDMETFSCVCHELIKIGESEKAEEVLEWRDFLNGE